MSIVVVLVTHNQIGHAMVETVQTMLGQLPLPLLTVAVSIDQSPNEILARSQAALQNLDDGDGVLVLTDAFGSTPSNIAYRLQANSQIKVVTGLNLPMLIRVFNYPEAKLEALADIARQGGLNGITCADGKS